MKQQMVQTTLLLPEDLYEQLRQLSYTSKTSQSKLIIEALRLLFRITPLKLERLD